MKKCRDCQVEKPLTEFFREQRNPDGYMHRCKVCKQAKTTAWRAANREKWNAYMRDYNLEHSMSKDDRRRKQNRTHRHRYGITLDERDAMFLAQNGLCAICKKKLKDGTHTHLDHDHKTGKIRELLCFKCNSYLGYIGENVDLAQNLVAYILKHKV